MFLLLDTVFVKSNAQLIHNFSVGHQSYVGQTLTWFVTCKGVINMLHRFGLKIFNHFHKRCMKIKIALHHNGLWKDWFQPRVHYFLNKSKMAVNFSTKQERDYLKLLCKLSRTSIFIPLPPRGSSQTSNIWDVCYFWQRQYVRNVQNSELDACVDT